MLANFCEIATNANPGLVRFRQTLDDLNEYISCNGLPLEMARRLREYHHQQRSVAMRLQSAKAVPSLSPALQVEVILYCHKRWLDAIWFVRDLEQVQCSWKERAPNAHPAFGHTYQKLDLGRWPV